MAEPSSKGTGRKPRSAAPAPDPATEEAGAAEAPQPAPQPTPESIGIEGVVRVGGHHLDDERGWVPDSDEE